MTATFCSKEWVLDLIKKVFQSCLISQQDNDYKGTPFIFAIDENGNYGYLTNNGTKFRKF